MNSKLDGCIFFLFSAQISKIKEESVENVSESVSQLKGSCNKFFTNTKYDVASCIEREQYLWDVFWIKHNTCTCLGVCNISPAQYGSISSHIWTRPEYEPCRNIWGPPWRGRGRPAPPGPPTTCTLTRAPTRWCAGPSPTSAWSIWKYFTVFSFSEKNYNCQFNNCWKECCRKINISDIFWKIYYLFVKTLLKYFSSLQSESLKNSWAMIHSYLIKV